MSVDVLIAPLRSMIDLLGTGTVPQSALAGLRSAPAVLDSAAALSKQTAAAVASGWTGSGGEAAGRRAVALADVDGVAGTDGADIAQIVESAAARVKAANTELNALVDSFVAAAAAVPSISTPAGLAALIPVAVDHIARGAVVIGRTHSDLSRDTAALGRHRAPAEVRPVGGDGTTAISGAAGGEGTRIVLPDGSVVHAPNERAATAVRAALSVQGTPYVWGGTTTDGFDCSGFTQWAYRQAGVELPRLAQDQDLAGYAVSQSELQPGDLAVWSGHVAMYIGNGQYVETGGDPVGVTPLRTSNAGQQFEGFYRPR